MSCGISHLEVARAADRDEPRRVITRVLAGDVMHLICDPGAPVEPELACPPVACQDSSAGTAICRGAAPACPPVSHASHSTQSRGGFAFRVTRICFAYRVTRIPILGI